MSAKANPGHCPAAGTNPTAQSGAMATFTCSLPLDSSRWFARNVVDYGIDLRESGQYPACPRGQAFGWIISIKPCVPACHVIVRDDAAQGDCVAASIRAKWQDEAEQLARGHVGQLVSGDSIDLL